MKTLLFVIVMSFFSICHAQTFKLTAEIGQGFKFIDYHNPQFYMMNASVKAPLSFLKEKAKVTSIVMTAFCDGYTYVFGGTGLSYQVYKNNNFKADLGITTLFGSEARDLYGINTTLDFGESFYISLNARQEYKHKEFWFDGAIGIPLTK